MKAVVDRIVQYPNRYKLTNAETGEVLGTFDFEEVTGTVQQVGTEIDKELFDSIANDLAARVKLSGGELAGTIVTFSDISGTAANVASGDTSATLWGKVKNWFSRLRALAFKNKVAAGDFEAGAIKNADVAADAAIAQSKVNGLMTDYVASISVSGRTVTYKNKNGVNMGSITTQDTTYGLASQSSNGLMSSTDKTKLDGIESGAQKNTVLGVKGSSESAYRTGNVNITKANIGLGNVDNTSDEDKPVSTATQTALNGKANTSGTYPNLTVGKATNADKATNATNATNAANATKATQDGNGNVIPSTYATKNELSSGLSGKANTSGSYPNLTVGKATNADNATNATKADAIKQTDTRKTNELPTFYYNKAKAGQNFTFEFKESAAIGLTGQSTYCQLQTYAKWTDSTGGNITQVAVVDTNYFIRTSTGSTGWGAWQRLLKEGEVGTVVKSASEWSSQNQVLSAGQFGYDTTGKITKIGDGSTQWTSLPMFETTDSDFASMPWRQIAALSESGAAKTYFSVGDEKTIELTTGEQVTLVILGFNHDDLTGGGKAGMTIGMKNLLATTYKMNSSNTNAGGWNGSAMRTSTMATLLSQLPADLRNVIKQVNKKATAGSQSTTITTSVDKLFLFALAELASKTGLENSTSAQIKDNAATYEQEGTQYEYFKNTVGDADIYKDCPALVKKLSNGGGSANHWWLRSPILSVSTRFWYVLPSGEVYASDASKTYGVSFGFCV